MEHLELHENSLRNKLYLREVFLVGSLELEERPDAGMLLQGILLAGYRR
jgi:hypothetical protein